MARLVSRTEENDTKSIGPGNIWGQRPMLVTPDAACRSYEDAAA
jgi:hypothetical protein